MPPQLAAFFSKYGVYIGIAVVGMLILTLAFCQGKQSGKQGEVINQQERELDFNAAEKGAAVTASDKRVSDVVRVAMEAKELQDALETETDPYARRVLRGCIVLRQQGRDTSGIPGCLRPASRPGTAVPDGGAR